VLDVRKNSNVIIGYMHELRQTHSAWDRGYKISLSQLWRNTDKTLRKVQKVWPHVQMPKVRFYRTIRRTR